MPFIQMIIDTLEKHLFCLYTGIVGYYIDVMSG